MHLLAHVVADDYVRPSKLDKRDILNHFTEVGMAKSSLYDILKKLELQPLADVF